VSWISVAERLPEPQERVLVWLRSHGPNRARDHVIIAYRIGAGDWIMHERTYDVTHWQPLPDPPAKGDG
jgi:hypothetical protein